MADRKEEGSDLKRLLKDYKQNYNVSHLKCLEFQRSVPAAICRPATDLHFNICVREVVLRRQLPIVVDEVVENGWAEYWLKKGITHFTHTALVLNQTVF